MKLKSFNYLLGLLIIFSFTILKSEEEIDIWKNNKEKKTLIEDKKLIEKDIQKLNLDSIKTIKLNNSVKIENETFNEKTESEIFGIYDPADNDFTLRMWSNTNAEDIKASLKRIEKIKLSKTANKILEKSLFSVSYAPK